MSATGSRTQRGGFTLIELLAVMVLLGLIAGLAEPWLKSLADAARFRSISRTIAGELETARLAARSGGGTIRFAASADGRALERGDGTVRGLPEGFALLLRNRQNGARDTRFFSDGSSEGADLLLQAGQRLARFTVETPLGTIRASAP